MWRGVLLVLLVWFALLVRDLARLRAEDATAMAEARVENAQRQSEQIRLLKAICLSTTTVYEAARGVCDLAGTAELKKAQPPKLRGGPYK